MATIYQINKGINKPIEFKGLQAQYIIYLGVGLLLLILLFAGMYALQVHLFWCISITGLLGISVFTITYKMNHRFGQYGLMKFLAGKKVPIYLKSSSRRIFLILGKEGIYGKA